MTSIFIVSQYECGYEYSSQTILSAWPTEARAQEERLRLAATEDYDSDDQLIIERIEFGIPSNITPFGPPKEPEPRFMVQDGWVLRMDLSAYSEMLKQAYAPDTILEMTEPPKGAA